jgi:toxin ParE1/3/4
MTLVIRSQAHHDLRQSLQYYLDQESPESAERFADTVDNAYDEILADPKRYPVTADGTRLKPVLGFPFSIAYSIESDEIVIVAIRHHKRRPEYWRK